MLENVVSFRNGGKLVGAYIHIGMMAILQMTEGDLGRPSPKKSQSLDKICSPSLPLASMETHPKLIVLT